MEGLPGSSDSKKSAYNAGNLGSFPGSGRFPWRRERQPTPVFLPGEFHGQRSLVRCSPWDCKELGTTERLKLSPFIDMYDPITIFLIIVGLFSVDLFLLLCFLPKEIPLTFVEKLVCWCFILLAFSCLERFLFLHQIRMRVLPDRPFLVVGSSLLSL